jgi:hypothetical protein
VAQIHDELRTEGVVKEGRAIRMSGKMGLYGRLWLTSERLVFLQSNRLFMGFGARARARCAVVKAGRNPDQLRRLKTRPLEGLGSAGVSPRG